MSATAGSVRRTPSNLRQGPGSHRLSLACATAADEGTKWYFVLIIVVPDSVDELHLGGNQRRYLHKREGNTDAGWVAHASAREADWTRQSVNP